MKNILNINTTGLAVLALLIVGCEPSTKTKDKAIDTFMESEFPQPDVNFTRALEEFDNGNLGSAVDELNNAVSYVKSLNYAQDTLYDATLEFAVGGLEDLIEDLTNDEVTNRTVLEETFVRVDRSIAAYHMSIVEKYFWNGSVSGEGLERLSRALTRLDQAVTYDQYELSEEEKEKIESLKVEISEAEKSSPGLYGKVSQFFKRVDKKLE